MARTQGESGPPKAIIAKSFFAAEIGRTPFQLSRKILARLRSCKDLLKPAFRRPNLYWIPIEDALFGLEYTFRTSNFGSARGGAWVSDKGFASMELA
ncbi:hypothetical protein [Methylotuvimicrobium buryatense]|uniref:Uncharacterized protein n=1 Tax=Methylotuvimicrobium buryatense TaxID=95641 RepID=A0A4P9UMV9_METBY|nr:hypothetical protein [Methylotuvimicrobium buryatense]QCW81531.1 hypothetical protein EQU24_04135 [Methylotuvimicrobium buryatense]